MTDHVTSNETSAADKVSANGEHPMRTKEYWASQGFSESMAAHLAKHSRIQKPMTRERVLAIAKSQGMFQVTLRYRDERLMAMCMKLKRDGLLTGGHRNGRVVQFYPVKLLSTSPKSEGTEPATTGQPSPICTKTPPSQSGGRHE